MPYLPIICINFLRLFHKYFNTIRGELTQVTMTTNAQAALCYCWGDSSQGLNHTGAPSSQTALLESPHSPLRECQVTAPRIYLHLQIRPEGITYLSLTHRSQGGPTLEALRWDLHHQSSMQLCTWANSLRAMEFITLWKQKKTRPQDIFSACSLLTFTSITFCITAVGFSYKDMRGQK